MRWPFSRRGNTISAPDPVVEPRREAASAPVQRKAEWATLPPIQRAAASPIELTAESGLFVENLSTRAGVEPTLQPLGHDVTMEAPSGIATGIARPVEHRTDGPPLQHRLHAAPASAPAASARAASGPLPSIHPPSAPAAAVQRSEESAVAPAPTEAPEPAVARSEAPAESSPAEAPPAAPAPVLEASTSPAPVQRAAADAPLVHRKTPTPAAPATPAGVQRHPGHEQAAAPPAPAPSAPAEVASAPAEAAAPQEAVAPTPASSPPVESPAPVQRAAEDAVESVAPTAAPETVAETPAPAAEQVSTTPAAAQVARAEDEGAPAEEEEAATSPALESDVQRAAEQPGEPAPTVGARPVVTASVFRSSLGPVPATVGLGSTDPLPFAAQRAPADLAASAQTSASTSWPAATPSTAPSPGAAEPSSMPWFGPPSGLGAPAPRAADIPQPAAGSAPGAAGPGSVQRAPEGGAASTPPARSAPTAGERRLGLGAPLKAHDPTPGSAELPPQPAPSTFRRTRSALTPQRAPVDVPGPAASSPPASGETAPVETASGQVAPSPEQSPSTAPLAGAKAPLAEPQALAEGAQRASSESPSEPLPPAQAPIAPFTQRAPEDASPFEDAAVQRAPEPGPSASISATGLDAFIAGVARLNAADSTPDVAASDPWAAAESSTAAGSSPGYRGPLAPRLDLPHRRRDSSPRSSAPAAGAAPAAAAAAVQRAPESGAAPARPQPTPVVGRRPLRVQRSSDDVPAPVRAHVEQHVATSLEGVRVHRSPESGSAARQLKAKAFTTGGEIHLPADHGPLDREPARSLVAHELVHVAQQRQLGANLPTEDSHHGRALEAQAQRVEVSTVQSASPLVLARKPDAGAIAENAAAIVAQRAEAAPTSSWSSPVQSAPAAVAPAPAPVVVSAGIQRAEVDPSGGGFGGSQAPDPLSGLPQAYGGGQHSPPLEESQLQQAWTYVRARLGDELTGDRERQGLRIDLF